MLKPAYGEVIYWLFHRRENIGYPTFYEFIHTPKLNTQYPFLVSNTTIPFEGFYKEDIQLCHKRELNSVCPSVKWDCKSFSNKLFVRIFEPRLGVNVFFTNEALYEKVRKSDHASSFMNYKRMGDFAFLKHEDVCDLVSMYNEFLGRHKGIYFDHFKKIIV